MVPLSIFDKCLAMRFLPFTELLRKLAKSVYQIASAIKPNTAKTID